LRIHRDDLARRRASIARIVRATSYELQCPEKQLQITDLSDKTAGVDGCGHRAIYVYNGDAGEWLLNGPISR
jgi:hypothetical protein